MGWDYTYGATRADIIRERTKDWDGCTADGTPSGRHFRRITHALRGNVLWSVWERTGRDGITVFIACDLLARSPGCGWGYKSMDESTHPFYYTCPLGFLDRAPVVCEAWREGVRAYHAERVARRARAVAP